MGKTDEKIEKVIKEGEESRPLDDDEVAAANMLLLEHGISSEDLSPEEAVAKAERLQAAKARAVQVLSRGKTLDALDMALETVPKGYVGEFVREDEMSVNRKRALGYELVEASSDKRRSLHPSGDSRVRVGDVVLMQIPEEEHVAIQAARQEVRQKRVAKNPAEKQRRAQSENIGIQTF